MKIIQFVPTLVDGGAETLVKDYLLQLKKDNSVILLELYTRNEVSANSQILATNRIKRIALIKHWSAFSLIFNHCNKLKVKIVSKKIKKAIYDEKPDVIHIHMNLLKYFSPIVKDLKGIKLFYTCHSIPERYFGKGQEEEMKAAQILMQKANFHIIALHDEMTDEINRLFGCDCAVTLNNPVQLDKFINPGISKLDIRKELDIPNDAFVIGHVGRFVASKNHDFLVDLFEKIRTQEKKAHLLLIGDGPEKENILTILKNKELIPFCTILSHRTDVNRLLKAMDVFVFPSQYEGFCIALIEAQASGLPCVVSSSLVRTSKLSEAMYFLPLDCQIDDWVSTVLEKHQQIVKDDIWKYDVSKVIKELEFLYNER